MRLTNDPAISLTSLNNSQILVHNSGILYLIFQDNRSGLYDIYIKSSADDGVNWSSEVKLTDTTEPNYQGILSTSNNILHFACFTGRYWLGTYNLFYKHSTNNGVTWSNSLKLTSNQGYYIAPSMAASGQYIHIVFTDTPGGNGNPVIRYVRSTDGGSTWSSDVVLVTGNAVWAGVATEGTNVHVTWIDARTLPKKVFYKRSTDNGYTWSNDTVISGQTSEAIDPSISTTGSRINVSWADLQYGNQTEVMYTYSTNSGMSWQPDIRLTNDAAFSESPTIISSGLNVHAAWYDTRDGNKEIYYKNSNDGGINWSPDIRITNDPGLSDAQSIYLFGNVLHLVWEDNRNGNLEVYYKRNPNGNMVGINNMNSNTPYEFKLLQNYPNPFNPLTKIRFSVPKQAEISINLFDITGRIISSIFQPQQFAAGVYEADFDGSNLSSGIYFYNLYADGLKIDTKKMVLVK